MKLKSLILASVLALTVSSSAFADIASYNKFRFTFAPEFSWSDFHLFGK